MGRPCKGYSSRLLALQSFAADDQCTQRFFSLEDSAGTSRSPAVWGLVVRVESEIGNIIVGAGDGSECGDGSEYGEGDWSCGA